MTKAMKSVQIQQQRDEAISELLAVCHELPQLPDATQLHKLFMSSALLDCATLEQEAYRALVTAFGADAGQLQAIVRAYAGAVVKLSCRLGADKGQLLLQRALSAAEAVHEALQHHGRDARLLEVAQTALAAAAQQEPQGWHWALPLLQQEAVEGDGAG